jgi:hypothetical protein
VDVRKCPDRRRQDATEFTGGEQLRIDFRRKQIRIAHWKLQHFLRAHELTITAKSTSTLNYIIFRIFFVYKIWCFSNIKLSLDQLALANLSGKFTAPGPAR